MSSRPLVIFIDEIDALQDLALISIWRQLCDGYPNRPKAFPQSVGLIGLRDVRDYKVAAGGTDTQALLKTFLEFWLQRSCTFFLAFAITFYGSTPLRGVTSAICISLS